MTVRDGIFCTGMLFVAVSLVFLVPGWLNNQPVKWVERVGMTFFLVGWVTAMAAVVTHP